MPPISYRRTPTQVRAGPIEASSFIIGALPVALRRQALVIRF